MIEYDKMMVLFIVLLTYSYVHYLLYLLLNLVIIYLQGLSVDLSYCIPNNLFWLHHHYGDFESYSYSNSESGVLTSHQTQLFIIISQLWSDPSKVGEIHTHQTSHDQA